MRFAPNSCFEDQRRQQVPIQTPSSPELILPSIDLQSCRVAARPWSRTRVVVVDDDAEMRDFLSDTLRDEGYDVVCAPDTIGAMMELLSREADALVLDWKMPQLDGFALLASIRRCFPRLPVIFTTAYPGKEVRDRAIAGGAFAFLPKPFSIGELLQTLDAGLEAAAR